MKKLSLGQDWVSRVTQRDVFEAPLVGTLERAIPDPALLRSLLDQISRTEAAREMARRRWIAPNKQGGRVTERGEAIFDFLFSASVSRPSFAMFKGRRSLEARSFVEQIATTAWVRRVIDVAHERYKGESFDPSRLNHSFLRSLARLSLRPTGPKDAIDAIESIGIRVVVETGLPGMAVDGASLHREETGAVIALTLRYDRLDNFWFTLLHELGHLALHIGKPNSEIFVDALEDLAVDEFEAEAEANAYAKDGLIPRDMWQRSDANRFGNLPSALKLARELDIHPAIVAGRIRHERRDFRVFSDHVGTGEVRDVLLSQS